MLGTCLDNVRETVPLVHNITNYVTVNDVANILLACGGSPIMSDEPEDVEDTTTFLDAWSAGISAESLSGRINGKKTAVAVTVIGVAGAIIFPMDDITNFLYLIGSVFAPMIAVQIADHFLLKRDRFAVAADSRNLVIWLIGFIAYRLLMGVDTPVGYTLPDMLLTVLLCVIAEKVKPTTPVKK